MPYHARFESISGHVFRLDTRIYLEHHEPTNRSGVCIGAIVGKNPGSARPAELGIWAPLQLNGDKMLPTVRNRFRAAYEKARKAIPPNAFVQVWNLFYLCDADLRRACSSVTAIPNPPCCPTESARPALVWFAWGGSKPHLDCFKQRFISAHRRGFFYSKISNSVVGHVPSISEFAKHPQGMPEKPVVEYLSSRL